MRNVLSTELEILVIDDQRDERMFFKKILENRGFTVIWRRGWKEVVQLLSERIARGEAFPGIVLVDMHFRKPFRILGDNPAMEGVLIVQKFSKTCEKYGIDVPPMIGFTGNEEYMQKQEMIQAGVADFITTEEFNNPDVLDKRLFRCIQEAQVPRMLKPPDNKDIQEVENRIVQRALFLNNDDLSKAADFLRWSIDEVNMVKHRLQGKE